MSVAMPSAYQPPTLANGEEVLFSVYGSPVLAIMLTLPRGSATNRPVSDMPTIRPGYGFQRPASLMQGAQGVERMVSRETMTIQIPDDLARGLEGIAAAQQKSVEQVALESLRSLFDRASSPEVVTRAVRELPHPSAAAVDDLEAAIAAARLPVRDQGAFDGWPPE
jgi:hypothetical protein